LEARTSACIGRALSPISSGASSSDGEGELMDVLSPTSEMEVVMPGGLGGAALITIAQ